MGTRQESWQDKEKREYNLPGDKPATPGRNQVYPEPDYNRSPITMFLDNLAEIIKHENRRQELEKEKKKSGVK